MGSDIGVKDWLTFILWTLVCFIVAWVLFSDGGCGHKAQPAVDNKMTDSLKTLRQVIAKRQDSITFFRQKDEYSNSVIEDVVKMFQDADSTVHRREDELKATQKQLALAKGAHDTIGQLQQCDSLNARVTEWRVRFDEADAQCNQYVFKTSRELYHKDSAIEMMERQIKDLSLTDTLSQVNYNKLKRTATTPLLRGYLGATGTVGAYNSFGIHLDLLNRKDFMYKGGVRVGTGGLSYEAGVSKLISFKKH